MKTREFTSQYLSPPIILNLSMQEAEVLNTHKDRFAQLGFEIEEFGGEATQSVRFRQFIRNRKKGTASGNVGRIVGRIEYKYDTGSDR